MYFRQFFDSANAAMSYLLADLPSKQAVVIDPSSDPCQSLLLMSLLAERELTLAHILLTHTHRQAANDLADHYRGTPIVVGKHTRSSIGDRFVEHGETIQFGDERIQVIATPGHTTDSVSYLWRDRLFCGDALELRGCARNVADDCDPRRIYDSVVTRLFALSDETLVFPGHDFHGRTVSTIGEERTHNPFFLTRSRDDFVTAFSTYRPGPLHFPAAGKP